MKITRCDGCGKLETTASTRHDPRWSELVRADSNLGDEHDFCSEPCAEAYFTRGDVRVEARVTRRRIADAALVMAQPIEDLAKSAATLART